MTAVRRLYVLLCGYEIMRKSISTLGRGHRFVLSEPISAYLLDTTEGWVLLDAGFDRQAARAPGPLQAYFDRTGCYPPIVGDEHLIDRQLDELGVKPDEIGMVILSHLHNDHTGFVKSLPNADVYLQRREWASVDRAGLPGCYAPADYAGLDDRLHLMDGDWEAMPGLRLIATPGHTEGHQSAVVDLPHSGAIVLPFDAGDLQENFDEETLPGSTCDAAAALASLRRIKAIVETTPATMILFHDPVAIQTTRLAPDFYD